MRKRTETVSTTFTVGKLLRGLVWGRRGWLAPSDEESGGASGVRLMFKILIRVVALGLFVAVSLRLLCVSVKSFKMNFEKESGKLVLIHVMNSQTISGVNDIWRLSVPSPASDTGRNRTS